mgnify:FL=1
MNNDVVQPPGLLQESSNATTMGEGAVESISGRRRRSSSSSSSSSSILSNELVARTMPIALNNRGRNIANMALRVEQSSTAVGVSSSSVNTLLASVAGEKVFPSEGGIQGRAYDVACESLAFTAFTEDGDNDNEVERAMRKIKQLRMACNGTGEETVEWKKHERCSRLAMNRCVEWMRKEYAGEEERKVVRLGVRAVTVLAKYADAGEYSKFKFCLLYTSPSHET